MKKFLSVFMLLVAVGSTAIAQVTSTSLSGVVSDGTGGLPGAVVSATYTPTGVVFYDVTNTDGSYRLINIIAGGPYTVQVQCVGFQSLKMTDLWLNLSDDNVMNLLVKEETIGLEEVVVTAKSWDRMSSDLAGSVTAVSAHQMSLVPTTTRSLNDILVLTPQATSTSEGLAVAGGNYRQSNVTVDGAVFNNSFGIGENLPAGGSPISTEALDQLAISITPYDVRQSGFVGGAIQATTKSGSNIWQASAYDYFTSSHLQGKEMGTRNNLGVYPATLQLTDMLRNTVGVSVGGPIVKNKLFFFFNAEYDVDKAPGQSRKASEDGSAHGQFNRPTGTELTAVRNFLKDKYGYDPGAYDSYSFNTPDWKIFFRLDWNINSTNRLTIRHSYTSTKTASAPSSSVSPFGNTQLYDRYAHGRVEPDGMYFQNMCYYQEQNFSSLAAEWNSRFFEGNGTNTLRATWSHQNEPRSYDGDFFPTVDILKPLDDGTQAVFTSFGIDPFTYGNLRDVHSVSVVDEFSYKTGLHTLLAGASFDYAKARNGFMPMGGGYYLYGSWEDFVNDAAPLAFAITHSNRDDLKQEYASITDMNVGLYFQDELRVNRRFNLVFGLRFDAPIYAKLHNENKAFTELFAETTGWRTDNVPKTYVSIAPRVGFNLDILGNRRLIFRGGTGYFVGTIPMVWLVSTVTNSNTTQAQKVLYDPNGLSGIRFHDNIDDILQMVYGGNFKQQELGLPYGPTVLADDLRMPSTWKTSLALDYRMPGDVRLSFEGIFNKDINSITISKGNLICEKDGLVLTEGVDVRNKYTSAGLGTTPYIIHNTSQTGYYASFTAKLDKSFRCGVTIDVAYTYSKAMTISDGLGDQVSSAYSFNTYSVNGSQEPELGYASHVTPHRLLANLSYVIEEGKHAATTLAMYYEGQQLGYVMENSYTRWTPTMSSNITGDGGAHNVIYIPTVDELEKMSFVSENNKADFNRYIMEHKELARHRGEYAKRGCMVMPWHSMLNFKLKQNLHFDDKSGRTHNVEVGWDVHNVLNLLHRDWGNMQCVDYPDILKWDTKTKTYEFLNTKGEGELSPSSSTASTWSMMLSLKYFF